MGIDHSYRDDVRGYEYYCVELPGGEWRVEVYFSVNSDVTEFGCRMAEIFSGPGTCRIKIPEDMNYAVCHVQSMNLVISWDRVR